MFSNDFTSLIIESGFFVFINRAYNLKHTHSFCFLYYVTEKMKKANIGSDKKRNEYERFLGQNDLWRTWMGRINGIVVIWQTPGTHRTTALYHFDQLPIDPIKIVCLQQEKLISEGKTFDILCLFCRSYELICAWKGWLYVSLWKLLFVFLYHWHFGGHWTTFLQIIMSKGLGAIKAKIGSTSDVDKIFSKMYSQHVLFRNKYS